MECKNKFCLWNSFGQCCPEDAETMELAIPDALDCPTSLRRDFQGQLVALADEVCSLAYQRNMKELIEIKQFIEGQRK